MESTTLKVENLKPIILKAGVPLAVSVAGVIYALIISKKYSSMHEEEQSYHHQNLSSTIEDEDLVDSMTNKSTSTSSSSSVPSGKLVIHDNPCLEQDIGGLRTKIEALQMKELALNFQLERFCDMKEQESLLAEIKNMLSIEAARAEFLDKEVSSLERVNLRLENFVVQYLRIVEKLEYLRSENRLLGEKVKKMIRGSKARARLIKEQGVKIKAREEEILRCHDELKKRDFVINDLEGEIREMQVVFDQLKDEKNEFMKKLAMAEKVNASKTESGDIVSKENYKKLLNELEQIKKEREAEIEEIIHLRWTNACLRHELMRHQQQQDDQDNSRDHIIGLEFEGSNGVVMHYESDHELHHHSYLDNHSNNVVHCFGSSDHSSDHHRHHFSKRKRLLRRLKRWVKSEGGNHLLGMNSVPHLAKETTHVPARKSFSSA